MENYSNNKIFKKGYVDIHCHCLPGLDDGPRDINEALALCRGLVDDGITVAIATPHQLGKFDGCNEPEKVRRTVSELNKELENNKINLTVMPGGDVRIDERISNLVDEDKIQTLADGRKYILLELPTRIFIDVEPLIVSLEEKGIHSIISHPERHFGLCDNIDIVQNWLKHSAHLQITAASLIGDFGREAQGFAWDFLCLGMVSFVATDAHNLRGRKPKMNIAHTEICKELSPEIAHMVCVENPIRLLEGREISPILMNKRNRIF